MKKKLKVSELFLYKYRFIIGYILLGLAFVSLVLLLPTISPNGLSTAEMESTVASHSTHFSSLADGNIVDLPYHVLQKISIAIFGLSAYAIKLPSMIISIVLGVLIVLLLNRWFKRNVALLASVLSVLSVPFFFLSGMGTPMIMFVFWPTLLLWLGGKVQGINSKKKQPKPFYTILLAFALVLSLFTPYMIYLALFVLIFAVVNPHLRFTVKNIPKLPLITSIVIILAGLGFVGFFAVQNTDTLLTLVFMNDFSWGQYFSNLGNAFRPFFTWTGNVEGVLLAPLVGLASLALAVIGLLSTIKGFFASRNALAICLIVFTIVLAGFNPDISILLILPLAILVAHGLNYILKRWYGLFPTNPYARIFAIIPVGALMGIILFSDISHFIFGYRYSPPVADQFQSDLDLIHQNLKPGDTLLVEADTTEYYFYRILNESDSGIKVVNDAPPQYTGRLATLGKWQYADSLGNLDRIITSPKSNNSDRIYLYTAKVNENNQ